MGEAGGNVCGFSDFEEVRSVRLSSTVKHFIHHSKLVHT